MNPFTGIFQGFYLDLKNAVLSHACSPYVLTQAPPSPPPANFEEPSMYVLNNFGKPCNIFRLSFITVAVVVLVFVFHIFLFSIYSEITCNLYYLCCSKMFFFIIVQFFFNKKLLTSCQMQKASAEDCWIEEE